MQVLCGLQGIFLLFNCQTPGTCSDAQEHVPDVMCVLLRLPVKFATILSLTVIGRKNRCIPCVYWATAIFVVVLNYSNLFLPFAFFLDCSHFTLGYELIVRPEIAGFVKSIRNLFPLV